MGIINSKKPNTLFRCLQQLLPVGTTHITTNGLHNVRNYEYADVYVPQGITPTGTISITNNGNYDVTQYANADVNVSGGGITPTGTKNITSNGIYDITTYANVNVNVSGAGIPNTYQGSFVYDGSQYVYLDHNFSNDNVKPSMMFLWDNDQTIPSSSDMTRQIKRMWYSPNHQYVYSVFATLFPLSQLSLWLNNDGTISGTQATFSGGQLMRDNHDLRIPTAQGNYHLITGHIYTYVIFCNEITYDFTNATLTKTNTSYSVNDDLVLTDFHLHCPTYINGSLVANNVDNQVMYTSNNVSVDTSEVDMTTAGTYPIYVSLTWNDYKSFTVYITVV